jgi:hypothetical protein
VTAEVRSIDTGFVEGVPLAGVRDRYGPVPDAAAAAVRFAALRPLIEQQIAASDRWIAAAASYLELEPDPAIAASIEPTRQRRDRLGTIHGELARLAATLNTPAMAHQLELARAALDRR